MHYVRVLFIPLILTLALWLAAVNVPAYNRVSEFPLNGGMPGDASAWRLNPLDALVQFRDGVRLESRADAFQRIRYFTDVNAVHGELVEIAATVEVEPIYSTEPSTAALAIWFLDNTSDTVGYINLFVTTNPYARKNVSHVVAVPVVANNLIIGISSRPGADTMHVQDLSLHVVTKNELYFKVLLSIVVAWSVYALLIGRWVVRQSRPIVLCALLLGGLALFIGVTSSADIVARFVHPMFRSIEPWMGFGWRGWANAAMNLGHLLGFLLVTVCSLLFYRRAGGGDLVVVLLMFVFAVATELVQLHLPDRSASMMDLVIDGVGIILGWTVLLIQSRKRP